MVEQLLHSETVVRSAIVSSTVVVMDTPALTNDSCSSPLPTEGSGEFVYHSRGLLNAFAVWTELE